MRRNDKLPIVVTIVFYTYRASLGIGCGASIAMLACGVAWAMGHPRSELQGIADSAWDVWCLSAGVWLTCLLIGWIADRARGL
jgi:hypothetical protein